MKALILYLVGCLFCHAAYAQTVRIKDLSVTDTQANSGQWLVTDDTDNFTKKLTLATLLGGWSGGVTIVGSPLTAEMLTLKGSALNDGDVIVNPDGGNMELGAAASTSGHAFNLVNDGTANLGVNFKRGAQDWRLQSVSGGVRLRDQTVARNALQIENASVDNALYIDADGHVGLGVDPTSSNNFHLSSSDTTFLYLVESTGTDAVMDLEMKNDAQAWALQVDGGNGDQFELRDVTGATIPVVVETSPPSNSLYIATAGDVAIGDGTPRLTGLTIRPGQDAGSIPAGLTTADNGMAIINTSGASDIAEVYIIAGTSGTSRIYFGDSADSGAGSVAFSHATGDLLISTASGTPVLTVRGSGAVNLEPRTTAPSSPVLGDHYVDDTGTDAYCMYLNGAWVVVAGGGSCA